MTADRAQALAVQARRNAAAKTRLNVAVEYLERARDRATEADMARQVRTLDRLIREATDLLGAWPAPVRDRLERAS
jgi:hypothetical protein